MNKNKIYYYLYFDNDYLTIQNNNTKENVNKYDKIPKLFTKRKTEFADNFKKWSKIIKDLHPIGNKLWTDEDNRNFIKNHYSWFLKHHK